TGLDEPGVQRKADLIASALRLHGLDATNASDAGTNARRALRCVGGLEIAAIAGGMIHAARNGVPTLVDGFIATAAALAATRMNAGLRPWLIFGHQSAEPGHRALLDALDAEPLLDLGLRLGEGTGAAAAVPLLRLACKLHNQMHTFAEAAVAGRTE
ncbi:MAG: nicotinate-nucleotide--dimethylbenzimidazole phosphoribosyltransferase, partial [Pseudomonadota bacterium]